MNFPTTAPILSFTVYGKPEPRGSKRAFMRPGMKFPVITDDNPKGRPWMQEVAGSCLEAMKVAGISELIDGPLVAVVEFRLARPKGHLGTGRNSGDLRQSAPAFPDVKPDTTKIWRLVEDALNGVLWRGDSQVIQQFVWKCYDTPPGCTVSIYPLPATVAQLAAQPATNGEPKEQAALFS